MNNGLLIFITGVVIGTFAFFYAHYPDIKANSKQNDNMFIGLQEVEEKAGQILNYKVNDTIYQDESIYYGNTQFIFAGFTPGIEEGYISLHVEYKRGEQFKTLVYQVREGTEITFGSGKEKIRFTVDMLHVEQNVVSLRVKA